MKKRADGTFDFSDIDPAVEEIISNDERRRAAKRLTPSQRRKAARDQARNRRMIDIPKDLEAAVEAEAAELSVPVSSLIVYYINVGRSVTDLDQLRDERVPTRSMRYEFIIPYKGLKK